MTARQIAATGFNFTGDCSGSIGAVQVEVSQVPLIFLSPTGGTHSYQKPA